MNGKKVYLLVLHVAMIEIRALEDADLPMARVYANMKNLDIHPLVRSTIHSLHEAWILGSCEYNEEALGNVKARIAGRDYSSFNEINQPGPAKDMLRMLLAVDLRRGRPRSKKHNSQSPLRHPPPTRVY